MKKLRIGDLVEKEISRTGPISEGEFVYVDISSIDRDQKNIDGPKILPVEKAPSRAKQNLKAGDVLVSMTRPNLNAVALVPDSLDGSVGSTGFHVLRGVHAESKFLFYAVQTQAFIQAMCAKVQGALYPAVRPDDISSFTLPPFSLAHQRRIVAKIEELFSELDAGVASLKQARTQLGTYRQSLLKQAFEGKLTAQWRRDHPDQLESPEQLLTRIQQERKTRYQQSHQTWQTAIEEWERDGKKGKKIRKPSRYLEVDLLGPSELKLLSELPTEWAWTKLGRIFGVFVGATPSRKEDSYWNGNAPWVSSGEVTFCRIKSTKEEITAEGLQNTSTSIHPVGTVILAMIGEGKTRGQAAILDIEAAHNQNTAAIRVSETECLPEFIYNFLLFRYEETRKLGSGNNQKALNKQRVADMSVPLCSLPEQQEIVRLLEEQFTAIEQNEREIEASLQRAEALRQSILKRAFSGQLVPQDPTDEPAAQLLARIQQERTEREAQAPKKTKKKATKKKTTKAKKS